MALQPNDKTIMSLIISSARWETLSLISAHTRAGRHRAVLCCLLDLHGKETYFPLAILAGLAGDEPLSDLIWPQLSCPVLLPLPEGEEDSND